VHAGIARRVPVRGAQVQLAPSRLQQRDVGAVADQRMHELRGVVVGAQQAGVDQRPEAHGTMTAG